MPTDVKTYPNCPCCNCCLPCGNSGVICCFHPTSKVQVQWSITWEPGYTPTADEVSIEAGSAIIDSRACPPALGPWHEWFFGIPYPPVNGEGNHFLWVRYQCNGGDYYSRWYFEVCLNNAAANLYLVPDRTQIPHEGNATGNCCGATGEGILITGEGGQNIPRGVITATITVLNNDKCCRAGSEGNYTCNKGEPGNCESECLEAP